MEMLTISITIILPLLIGYLLGKTRDSDKIIFNKKLEIYSDIVYHLNAAKYLRPDLDISIEQLKSLTRKIDNIQEDRSYTESSLDSRFEELDKKMSLINYRDGLIKLFAPARLIGSGAVVGELREYFSLISEFTSIEEGKDIDGLNRKISKSVMELEQLMRKDLGGFRLLSKLDIWWHLRRK